MSGKTARTQFGAGKVRMNGSYVPWVNMGGEREEGDRITSRLLLRASGRIVVPVTEMGNLERGAVWGRGEGGDRARFECVEF